MRDIRWVYNNLANLTANGPSGEIVVNEAALRTAPGPGALTMARYAIENAKGFIEKFVPRMLPKDMAAPKGESEAEIQERLDPELSDLQEYFQSPTREKQEDEW